jgi:ComF family protein
MIQIALDAFLPLSRDASVARSLSPETIVGLLQPIIHPEKTWITTLFPYKNNNVRALVRAIKYRGETACLPPLGRIMADELLEILSHKQSLEGWQRPLLIPIPASKRRFRARGYNQAERIASAMLPSLQGRVLYEPYALARDDRASQVGISKNMREKNISGAFFVSSAEKMRGMHAVLIDDVAETGATLEEARRALLSAGVIDVIALALAH